MNLLALDASTVATGYALFTDGEHRRSGVYCPPPDLPWWQRVAAFERFLRAWGTAPGRVHALAYEIARGDHGNGHTDRVLGALECVARQAADKYGWQFIEVNPQAVKATACHKGALVYAAGVKGAPLDADNPGDEADAIGVALVALGQIKEDTWTKS